MHISINIITAHHSLRQLHSKPPTPAHPTTNGTMIADCRRDYAPRLYTLSEATVRHHGQDLQPDWWADRVDLIIFMHLIAQNQGGVRIYRLLNHTSAARTGPSSIITYTETASRQRSRAIFMSGERAYPPLR